MVRRGGVWIVDAGWGRWVMETQRRKSRKGAQNDPPSLGSRLRRATAWQDGVASQIKVEAKSLSRACDAESDLIKAK